MWCVCVCMWSKYVHVHVCVGQYSLACPKAVRVRKHMNVLSSYTPKGVKRKYNTRKVAEGNQARYL